MGVGYLYGIRYQADERDMPGTSVYDFRVYPLPLLGELLLTLSIEVTKAVRRLLMKRSH